MARWAENGRSGFLFSHRIPLSVGRDAEERALQAVLVERLVQAFPSMEGKPFRYALAIWTDRVDYIGFDEVPVRAGKLLELRAFNDAAEARIVRTSLGADFRGRIVCDAEPVRCRDEGGPAAFAEVARCPLRLGEPGGAPCASCGSGCFSKVCAYDEWQFLDADAKAMKVACLPKGADSGCDRVHIRNYICYDEDGLAYVADFRIVGFEGKGGR